MVIFMYIVGKCVIYIYIIVYFFKNEWVYKVYEDVYDKKNLGFWFIYWYRVFLYVVIEKLEVIIKIIELNCFYFDFEYGEYILNYMLKNLERK